MAREEKIVLKGWDRPLVVDWDFQTGLLRREIQAQAPGRGGALKQAFDSPDTAVINEEGNIIDITVGKQHKAWPYAKIQEYGGPSHDVIIRPKRAKALRFYWMGRLRFFQKVVIKAGSILGSHYVERGVLNWWRKLTEKQAKVVYWASEHYSRGINNR